MTGEGMKKQANGPIEDQLRTGRQKWPIRDGNRGTQNKSVIYEEPIGKSLITCILKARTTFSWLNDVCLSTQESKRTRSPIGDLRRKHGIEMSWCRKSCACTLQVTGDKNVMAIAYESNLDLAISVQSLRVVLSVNCEYLLEKKTSRKDLESAWLAWINSDRRCVKRISVTSDVIRYFFWSFKTEAKIYQDPHDHWKTHCN